MGVVGCYTIHVYCDAPGCAKYSVCQDGGAQYFGEYSGDNERDAMRQARNDGWLIKQKAESEGGNGVGVAFCEYHKRRMKSRK